MRSSITLWQFAKGAQITFGAVAKGFSNIPLGELDLK
jgi:hypothetical protein